MMLVQWAFVASQVLDGFGTLHMLDGNRLTLSVVDLQWSWRIWTIDHDGFPVFFEVIVDDMVFAFGEFQFLVGCCNDVVPQLTVAAGLFYQFMNHLVDSEVELNAGWDISPVVHIINKSQQVDDHAQIFVRAGIGCPSVGLGSVQIIQGAGDEEPVKGRVAAALPSAKPRALLGMFCIFSRYSELCSQVVFGLAQSLGLHNTDFGMEAVLAASQVGEEAWNPVITGSGIIVKVYQRSPGHSADFIFEFPNKDWVEG